MNYFNLELSLREHTEVILQYKQQIDVLEARIRIRKQAMELDRELFIKEHPLTAWFLLAKKTGHFSPKF